MGLFDMFKNTADKPNSVKDPICGMNVNLATAEHRSVYKGKQYAFCSESCKKTFDINPSKYIR